MKRVLFRADSSYRMGTGHVMRCLTLASEFKHAGYTIDFICKDHQGNINQQITAYDFRLILLSPPKSSAQLNKNDDQWLGCAQSDDAKECINKISENKYDIIIVDHYSLDQYWHLQLKSYCHEMVVIDDLANRQYHCDTLIDQSLSRAKTDYLDLVPKHCQLLLGKDYMLLRKEFYQNREVAVAKRNNITSPTNVLITLGGTDPDNISQRLLQWLIELRHELRHELKALSITVVISADSTYKNNIERLIKNISWITISIQPPSMAKLMLWADIAIGTSGGTAWERCSLGLPSINIISANNQNTNTENLLKANAIVNLGWHEQLTKQEFSTALSQLITTPELYQTLVNNSFLTCDGLGVQKVIEKLTA